VKIGLTFGMGLGITKDEILAVVRRAEELGYHSVWMGEGWGPEVFTQLTWLACNTHSIKVGTGIANVFSRSPALMAQAAATLDEISGGRFILGLGTSGPGVIENWHGIPFRKPVRRTREYIEIVRKALAGERVDYQGELFHLSGLRLAMDVMPKHVPIYVAAMGPENIRLVGELADGWMPIWLWPDYLEELKRPLVAATQAAGRSDSVAIAPYALTCVADGDLEEVRRLARAEVALYVGGMGTFYNDLVRRYGFETEAAAIKEAWGRGGRREAIPQVSDELLAAVTNVGSAQECRRKAETYASRGVDLYTILFPHGVSKEMVWRTIEAMAPGRG